ncbi:MBL fold metallo-hydrolase [Nocardiopsis sp. NPDC006139]|uniref:MBL fold metallo-hydrolase n=1 Tax=unclassified Nocardiopsis TaxID=2649073 RepID=UPI0033BE62D4
MSAPGTLELAARAVMDRPGFGGPESSPDKLAAARADWLLDLLTEFPSLGALVRSHFPREHALACEQPARDPREAFAVLLSHPDPRVRACAAAVRGASPAAEAPHPVAEETPPGAGKKVQSLERRLAEALERRRRAEGKLRHLRQERDAAQAEVRRGESWREEAAEEASRLREEIAALRAERRDPRVLGRRLLSLWDASVSRDSRDPRSREEERGLSAVREAAVASGVEVPLFVRVLRALADPGSLVRAPAPRAAASEVRDRSPRVVQLGGGTEIGGSCVLVEAGATRLLVDAGRRPGDSPAPPGLADLAPGPLDAVIVTHAHNDHAGYVPALLAERGPCPVVCTPETAELLPVMWEDTAKVTRMHGPAPGGFGPEDVRRAVRALTPVATGVEHGIGDLVVELFPSGHIVGAAGAVVRAGEHRTVVSGDIADFPQESVGACELPESAQGADLLVLESTCCDRSADRRSATVERMLATVAEVCRVGGRVLVPAMALGRAQEVALIVKRGLPDVPVLVDGMARTVAERIEQATLGYEEPVRVLGDGVRAVGWSERGSLVESFRGGVVISPAGNLSAGPVVEWARSVLPDPRDAILVAGRQDEDAAGGRLLDTVHGGDHAFVLRGRSGPEELTVRARVVDTRLSAHADREGLLRIVDRLRPGRVRLVHGVESRQRGFGRLLKERGHAWEVGAHGV